MKQSARNDQVFSFKDIRTEESEQQSQGEGKHRAQKNPKEQLLQPERSSSHVDEKMFQRSSMTTPYQYRIDQLRRPLAHFERVPLNLRDLDRELENNARRRLELQKKALAEQIINREKSFVDKAVEAINQPTVERQTQKFVELQLERARKSDMLYPWEEKPSKRSQSIHPRPQPAPLNPADLLALSRKLTFPQVPQKVTLQSCQKRLEQLSSDHHHSDVVFLLMIVHFHLQQYGKVLELFEDLLKFKVVNSKAYWIAAQTYFAKELYEKCMKVCELAINNLDQSIFPRLLYLRARSAYLSLHYSEATVLYNQLIKLCPKIPEYRLQRAMLFEQTGMYDFARQDFVEYSKLVPLWKDQFKEQVLLEKDPLRKQHLLDCLAKLKGYT